LKVEHLIVWWRKEARPSAKSRRGLGGEERKDSGKEKESRGEDHPALAGFQKTERKVGTREELRESFRLQTSRIHYVIYSLNFTISLSLGLKTSYLPQSRTSKRGARGAAMHDFLGKE